MVEYLAFTDKEGKEQSVPIKYGFYAMKMIKNHYNGKKTYQDAGEDLEIHEPFLFYAMKMGHQLENLPFEYKVEDMAFILEQKFLEIMEIFGRMHETPEDKEKRVREEGKKPSAKK
jgi:hypothetical protein